MKSSVIAFSAVSVLVISLITVGTFETGIVSALSATTTDATSTASDTTTALTSSVSASTTSATDESSTLAAAPAQTQTPAQSQAQSLPSGKPTLKLVQVVGSKFIDYFTDGTKTYSFPGNRDIDSNLNKPNAPIPTHGNLKWVSTSGMEAYDTPSGDLEVGDYAQEADGSYITNLPASTDTELRGETRGRDTELGGGIREGGTVGRAGADRDRFASISREQKTRIHSILVRDSSIHRYHRSDVDFAVRVGSRIPDTIEFYDAPAQVIRIDPVFREYKIVVLDDVILVVDPATREIVDVIRT